MTDNTELKRLAEAATPGPWYQHGGIMQVLSHDCETVCETFEDDGECPDAQFIAAANPAAVLALIAENERLTKAVGLQVIRRFVGDDDQKNIDELVAAGIQVDKELIVQLKAENERLTGCIVQRRAQAEQYDQALIKMAAERDRLSAEVAGLRTGYEAYERVNAELKAEVEGLRNSSSCVDDLSALVRQLVHRLRKAAPDNDLPEKALDYLKRKGLQGSPLRNEHDDAAEREAQKIYESWADHDGFVPWVKGGNSLKQDEARSLARAAMGKGEQS